jgi:PhnB protein
MQPIPYVFLPGNCREAFGFWAEVFRADPPEIVAADDQMPGVPTGAVMHAALKIGAGWIYGSDDYSPEGAPPMAGASISLSLPDAEEARRVFAALADGGEVRQPMIETFFSPAFGLCSDRFGVRWMILAEPAPQQG